MSADELAPFQLLDVLLDVAQRAIDQSCDNDRPEDSSDDRRRLENALLLHTEQVDARRQRRLNGIGEHDLAGVAPGPAGVAFADQDPVVDQVAKDLLKEE